MSSNRRSRRAAVFGAALIGVCGTPQPGAWAAEQPATTVASSNPISGDASAITPGEVLYMSFCRQCHGVNADGISPRFGKHGADLRKFWRGYSEFVRITQDGLPGKQMPPWKEYLNVDQISQIGAYLETLALDGAKWKD